MVGGVYRPRLPAGAVERKAVASDFSAGTGVGGSDGGWRTVLWLGVWAIVVGTVYTVLLAPAVEHTSQWQESGDVWLFVDPARSVLRGDLFFVCQGNPYFSYPPGIAVLLAPVVAFGDLHLSDNVANPDHSTLWLLLGPAGLALTVPLLRPAGSLLRAVNRAKDVAGVQVALVVGFAVVECPGFDGDLVCRSCK
jgi:hypothetical protein